MCRTKRMPSLLYINNENTFDEIQDKKTGFHEIKIIIDNIQENRHYLNFEFENFTDESYLNELNYFNDCYVNENSYQSSSYSYESSFNSNSSSTLDSINDNEFLHEY